MRKIHILFAVLLVTNLTAFGQETENGSGIYFGAIVGTKYNDFNRHFALDMAPELYSFSIGAGSAWTKNNYVIGFEFLYSSAQKDNATGVIQYVGFSNTLSFGYNLARGNTLKIEPTIGLVLNNNQLIVQDNANTFSQNLTNNPISGNIALNIKAIDKKGLFTGLKIGYIMPFRGETEWENKVQETSTGLKDNMGTFYVQLNLGGLLKL